MEILCTRPSCHHPQNIFPDLDDLSTLETVEQRYCTSCGMPLILAGRYIPSRLLGQGGFGAAFLAIDRYTPALRQCVVKQFQPSGNLNAKELAIAQRLFKREAAVLEKLGNKHDQIPDLYAFFPLIVPSKDRTGEEQLFYLAQEYIEGQTLETELVSQKQFSEGRVAAILEDILNILKFIHDNGSIHRDIKPSNIIRTPQGTLYLLDFGAVKEIAAGASNPQTRSTNIYSMGFAPPEQMKGTQVFPSTDLYALAVTCLNLLTGKDAAELYDTYNNHWNWKSSVPQISNKLAGILDRMLLSTPKERFQSADEVLKALKASVKAQTPPPSINPSPQPPVKPSPPPVVNPPPQPRPISRRRKSSFSLIEILSCAGFTGFEGTLLFIALSSLLGVSEISLGLLGMCLGGLIFAQYGRIVEKLEQIVIVAISLGLVWYIPLLHKFILDYPLERFYIPILAALVGAGAIAVVALFRLVLQIIRRLI